MKKKRLRKRLLSGMLAVLILTASNVDIISIMSEVHPIRNVAEKIMYWVQTGDNPFIEPVLAADGSSDDPFYVKSSGSLTVKLNDKQYTDLDDDVEVLKRYMGWLNQRIGTGSGGMSVQGWLEKIDDHNEVNFEVVQKQLSSIDSHIGDINANLEVIQRQLANSTHNYRVANLHLINAKLDNALWVPYTNELPYIKEWSQVAGQFAAVDDATWNTSIKTLYNPGNNLTKRQLEILGYDAIVRAEGMVPAEQVVIANGSMTPEGLSTYGSTVTQVSRTNEQGETEVGYGADIPATYLEYVQNLIPENDITWLDAVTVLYKALGQDQLTYQSFISYNKSITPETSAVYKGLSNIGSYEYTPDSNQGDVDQHGDIADSYGGVTPGTDPNAWNVGQYNGYDDYIFVTRANVITSNDETPYGTYDQNLLYWNKAVSGGFIYDTSGGYDKWQDPISGAEFMKLAKAMMIAYGEPEMSDSEQKALLQVYGSSYPVQLGTDVADAWAYLKCRGILVDADDFYTPELFIDPAHNMTRAQLLDACMKIKDKDSRSDYKVIQITLDLSDVMQENGYYPVYNLKTEDTPDQVVTNVDYSAMHHYTYLIRCNDSSKIGDNGSGEVCTLDSSGKLVRIDGGVQPQLLEWQDALWYIVSIPTSVDEKVYIRKQTYDGSTITNKNVEWIEIDKDNLGGGIYNTPRKDKDKNGNNICRVEKVDKEWYSFVDFATDQKLIYYADATRAGFSKLNKDTVAKGSPNSYHTVLDNMFTAVCSIFMPLKVNAAVTSERENAHWNIKVAVDNKAISTSSTVEMSYPVMGAAYPLSASRKLATTWEAHYGNSKKLTDKNLLNCIAIYMCDPGYSKFDANQESVDATLKWIKDNKSIFDTSNAKSRNEKAYGDTLLYMAYRGLESNYKKYHHGSALNNFRDEKAALYNKVKGKLNPPVTVTFDPKVYSAKYSELDGFGDGSNYEMSDTNVISLGESTTDVQLSNLYSAAAICAREGTKELVLNRVATATESSEVADAILNDNVVDAFEKLKSGKYVGGSNLPNESNSVDPDSANTSSMSANPGVMVLSNGDEAFDSTDTKAFTRMSASWLKYAMGVNPVPCMNVSEQGAYSLKATSGNMSDDHVRFIFAGQEIPDKFKTQAYYEDGTYDTVKYAVENNIFVGGQFKSLSSADLSVQYYAACDDPEKLNTFLSGLDATGPVEELNTGTNVFSDAIMNRDQIILVKWSDLVRCGYVIPTAESNMKNGPVLQDGYYTFYTQGGRVRVNNDLLTIQIGTTLFDLSEAEYDVKPILVYQGEKDESGFYDTYLDYRCVLGVASRAKIKDEDTTEIVNQSLGNAAGGYVVYKFDTSSVNSDMWHTQKVNGYNFPEKSDYGKTPASGNEGYPVQVLKDMPYWDNQPDKAFDYGDEKGIIYWDQDTADKYPANRFVMASFYPTANWVVTIRDGGTDAIREAKLYVYYPIQAFTQGFADTDGTTLTKLSEEDDYWNKAPWHGDETTLLKTIDEADATYSGSLTDTINKAYPDHESYESEWWWKMTKYAYASQWSEMRKCYISGDFVVRVFNLTDSSIEVPNSMTWTDTYRKSNDIGALYWVNTIGFIYNMPNAANESESPFTLKKYFTGEYALPIAIVNDASKSGTYGIINYNLDYYGYATVKGNGKEPGVFEQLDSVKVPYGYAFSDDGWTHYTSSDGKSNNAGLPTNSENKIFKNGELNVSLDAPLPFVIDNYADSSIDCFTPAPVGVYSIISGDHETVDMNSIHTYVTQVNQFYYGSRRIVLRASNNQDIYKSYTIVSDNYNPIQFTNDSMLAKSYRVYRNKTMDVFVMEHTGSVMSGVDNVRPIESEDLMTSELTNFLDGLGATTLIKNIDEGSSFLITIAFFVMPLIGIILMTILVGLSFISEVRFVQMFCDKFFDPIRLLTFGNRDIHTWTWRKVLVPCILLYTSFALFMNGNVIRLVMWIGKWYGIVSNYFANRF